MDLRALIFDVDGTIAHTERDGHRVAFNRAFSDIGLDWNWGEELYGELLAVAGGKERIAHYVGCFRPEWQPRTGRAAAIADIHRVKTEHYERLVQEGSVPLRPGVLRLITEARHGGVRLAIATTTSRRNVNALLDYCFPAALSSCFDVIVTGDEVGIKKPSPDVYQHVLRELKLTPRDVIAIEDSENGLRAAQAAGIGTLITTNGYSIDQNFEGAMAITSGLGENAEPAVLLSSTPEMPLGGACVVDLATIGSWWSAISARERSRKVSPRKALTRPKLSSAR
jgi:HAD superfamily hydrolase (TIGR01509 family)